MCPSQLVTHTTNPTPTHSNNHHTGSHHHTPEPDRRCTPHTHTTHTSQKHTNMSLPTCAANVRQRCVRACDTPQRTNTHPPQSQRMHAQQTIRPRNKPRARKMLASTIQISNNNPTPPTRPHQETTRQPGPTEDPDHPTGGPIPQNPNSVPPPHHTQHRHTDHTQHKLEGPRPAARSLTGRGDVDVPQTKQHQPPPHAHPHRPPRQHPGTDRSSTDTAPAGGDEQVYVLLRKEVIQPHLPVRLPCYDFVPIASPTFDHSPRKTGWAVGFGCCRLS